MSKRRRKVKILYYLDKFCGNNLGTEFFIFCGAVVTELPGILAGNTQELFRNNDLIVNVNTSVPVWPIMILSDHPEQA